MTPTARALAECRRRSWPAQVVEQTVPHTFIKRDLFGVIDIIAITPDGILGIQVTSGSNHAARVAKISQEPRMAAWLRVGARLAVWSWARQGAREKRKLWRLREDPIDLGLVVVAHRFEPRAVAATWLDSAGQEQPLEVVP